jgi:saccharopine dehydrogenase-like NADP-dependent oxidoreductase
MKFAILGQGRVAHALQSLLAQSGLGEGTLLAEPVADLSEYRLLLGTLAGGLGPRALELALRHGIDLIDLADLETDVFDERHGEIVDRGICVIPAAGFCPGLVNLILGHELALGGVREVEVMAGSLSVTHPHYFPFLWCFEDMVMEFDGPSVQIVGGREKCFSPWADLREETIHGVKVESYLCQSGFENLARSAGVDTFTYRNLRPEGFHHLFKFLRGHGAFDEEHIDITKALLEHSQKDNLSLARITSLRDSTRRSWEIVAESPGDAPLNSIQRLTAGFALEVARLVIEGRIGGPGVHWSEELGHDQDLVTDVLAQLRKRGTTIQLDVCPLQATSELARPEGGAR